MRKLLSIKKSFALFALTLAIALASQSVPTVSRAYVYNGYHWPSYPVSVDVSDASLPFSWISPISSAMSAWNGASSPFYFNSGQSGHKMLTANKGANNTPGITRTDATGYNITDNDTTFNTYYSWATNGDPYSYDIQSVATHELGHWLNLADKDSGYYDTMYGGVSTGETWKRTLESDDLAGINYIYP